MVESPASQFLRAFRSIVICSVLIVLLPFGCTTPPTMKDATEVADDAAVVFGSVAVFDEIVALYGKKFPARGRTAVKQLFEPPKQPGSFSSVRGQCHESWSMACGDRFSGVTPISPDVSRSGYPTVGSLRPEFRWQPSIREDVSYDLILYDTAAYVVSGANVASYMRGRVVAYEEDLKAPYWQPQTPLKPDTRYIWSVRLRDDDTVSGWTTHSHFTFMIVAMSSGYGQWFQFRTPSIC